MKLKNLLFLFGTGLLSSLAGAQEYGTLRHQFGMPPMIVKHCVAVSIESQWSGVMPIIESMGSLWVVAKHKEPYSIVLNNNCNQPLLAVVSVDGLNVLDGKTASVNGRGYILRAGSATEIKGWRKSTQESAEFYFTTKRDSYAGRTGQASDLGVIGVAFFNQKPSISRPHISPMNPRYERDEYGYGNPSFKKGEEQAKESMQRSEPSAADSMQGAPMMKSMPAPAAPQMGTGHGNRVDDPVRIASFERAPYPSYVYSLRYDSYENLVKKGIILNYEMPRQPSAFPADNSFVPDPPGRRW